MEITEEAVGKALDCLVGGLDANKSVRAGKGAYKDEPDHKVRLAAAELLLAYRFGRPANTTKNLNLNVSTSGDGGRLQDSAAIIKKLVDSGMADNTIKDLMRKTGADACDNAKQIESADAVDI